MNDSTTREVRDPRGRFQVGNPGGPGGARPRGIDLRKLVEAKARDGGFTLETAVWAVFTSMLRRARDGDVNAAKLILSYLCDTEPQKVSNVGVALTVVTNVPAEPTA